MLAGIDGSGTDLSAQRAMLDWPTEFRGEDIELDENGFSANQSLHGWLGFSYQGVDDIRTKIQNPSILIQERPRTPLERFCTEDHRHEKIALMMRETGKGSEAHRGSARKHSYGSSEDEDVPTKRMANKSSPHCKPPSPFQLRLEVDGTDDFEEEAEGEGAQLEAIKIAARIETERIQRRGQRECREGRVRKKIRMAKRVPPVEPG